jgi:UDP-N-acetylglucosamine:LPS N-acetylglucosamine transferase
MGIAVAKACGMASILIENFTWDWIYEGYRNENCRIIPHIEYLKHLFECADYHIQTEPICVPSPDADLTTLPISRKIRTQAKIIREQLGIPQESKAVLITMGGIEEKYGFIDKLDAYPEVYFVIPGGSCVKKKQKRLILLPHHCDFYHPDLVNACDAVIGKVGYSTLAEVWQAGVPFGYVPRPFFSESEKLVRYIEQQMNGMMIEDYEFEDGRWLTMLKELLSMPRTPRNSSDGAVQAARFILNRFVHTWQM